MIGYVALSFTIFGAIGGVFVGWVLGRIAGKKIKTKKDVNSIKLT